MSNYFVKSIPSIWIQLKHSSYQILEVIAYWYDLLKDLPEVIRFVSSDKSVVLIIHLGLIEWLALGDHHEQHD